MTKGTRAQTWVSLSVASAMLASALAVVTVGSVATSRSERALRSVTRASPFVVAAFAESWEAPARRTRLAHELARTVEARVEVRGAGGELLTAASPTGEEPRAGACSSFRAGTVSSSGRRLGEVRVCARAESPTWLAPTLLLGVLAVVCALVTLVIARALVVPLGRLARAADGAAKGEATTVRFDAGVRAPRELTALAESIESMRSRLARHAASGDAVMAALSHELRSPLARLRVAPDAELSSDAVTIGDQRADEGVVLAHDHHDSPNSPPSTRPSTMDP